MVKSVPLTPKQVLLKFAASRAYVCWYPTKSESKQRPFVDGVQPCPSSRGTTASLRTVRMYWVPFEPAPVELLHSTI